MNKENTLEKIVNYIKDREKIEWQWLKRCHEIYGEDEARNHHHIKMQQARWSTINDVKEFVQSITKNK